MMRTGLWLLALSVILGAFGAHGLQMMVIPDRLETWDTAVRYHAWISILLIMLGGSFFRSLCGCIDYLSWVFRPFLVRCICWLYWILGHSVRSRHSGAFC